MFLSTAQLMWLLLPTLVQSDVTADVSYAIPASPPSGSAALDPAPVGISFEFFTFPSYFTNVTGTNQCLNNLRTLTGIWPPIRIGGTTQDRAQYDASTSALVVYTVADPKDAPAKLTFGSAFFKLAGTYAGTVVVGLNRGYNNLANTIDAAKVAKSNMVANLLAFELGNEPEYYAGAKQPVAVEAGNWTPAADGKSQNKWTVAVGAALNTPSIIQCGNSDNEPPTWGAAELFPQLNVTARSYVHDYAHHHYPGGSVTSLMSHSGMVSNMNKFKAEVAAATSAGKEYVMGETNSVSGGGAAAVSPTFGAALWTMDYILHNSVLGIKRSYFHHGTIGACQYCWWGRYNMGAPYYGAYAAQAALAGGSYIAQIDAGDTAYAIYVVFDAASKPLRALLYNSNYYAGNGTRSTARFVLSGLFGASVRSKRLTAANALSRADAGGAPTWGGQQFADVTCKIGGTETYETTAVVSEQGTFLVAASEALLVYL